VYLFINASENLIIVKIETMASHLQNAHQGAEFSASQWKYIMKLLGLVVVANKRVVPEEVDAYINSMRELVAVIDPTIVLTRHMIKDWLVLNKKRLIADIESLEYDSVLLELLSHIKTLPFKLDVVTAMVKVAIADDNYTNLRKALIKKTIVYWNIRPDLHNHKNDSADNSQTVESLTA